MSRVNIIDPKLITNRHLVAEIHEINQIAGQFKKSLISKNGINQNRIKSKYTLNSGHIYFFYDKGLYLHNRFNLLKVEGINRGFKIQKEFQNEWLENNQFNMYNDWIPTKEDYQIIVDRIILRVSQKPHLYKDVNNNLNEYFNKLKEIL